MTGHLQSSGLPYESGYTHGFTLLALLCLAAALAALLVPARRAARLSGPRASGDTRRAAAGSATDAQEPAQTDAVAPGARS